MDATQATRDVIKEMAAAMEEQRRYLTKLDSEIGDGDHGNNMNRGFQAALERLDGADPSTPADVLKAVSMALISKVGGAAGPLYGTAFLEASKALADKEEVSAEDVAEALEAALGGLKKRGKAEVGDKTMIDALEPAVEAAKEAAGEGSVAGVFRRRGGGSEGGGRVDGPAHGEEGEGELSGGKGRGASGPWGDLYVYAPGCRGADPGRLLLMVGIVLVSHSKEIAEGTADLVLQMAGEVEISAVGGDADGSFGTDPERIEASIRGLEADEVLVFMDLGSAVLSAETVLEMLPSEKRDRVRLVDAPFVEGAFAAGVMASTGADAEECIEAAMEARTEPKLQEG